MNTIRPKNKGGKIITTACLCCRSIAFRFDLLNSYRIIEQVLNSSAVDVLTSWSKLNQLSDKQVLIIINSCMESMKKPGCNITGCVILVHSLDILLEQNTRFWWRWWSPLNIWNTMQSIRHTIQYLYGISSQLSPLWKRKTSIPININWLFNIQKYIPHKLMWKLMRGKVKLCPPILPAFGLLQILHFCSDR